MIKASKIPYTWAELEKPIREAIICWAIIVHRFGPNPSPLEDLCKTWTRSLNRMHNALTCRVGISRSAIGRYCTTAYNYAYQVKFVPHRDTEEAVNAIYTLLACIPESIANGLPPPFDEIFDPPLRRMLETFIARFHMFSVGFSESFQPTIRQISLLASMNTRATVTALSKDGLRLERHGHSQGESTLNPTDAKIWLLRQRGFIPQRQDIISGRRIQFLEDMLGGPCPDFPEAAAELMILRGLNPGVIASDFTVNRIWLAGLLEGRPVALDLAALKSLAIALKVSGPGFVAAGVRHLMEASQSSLRR